jgi:mxaJ protein
MSLRFHSAVLALGLIAVSTGPAAALTVCSDPNNLPFSNRAGQGFENKIMEVMADELGEKLDYTWRPQRRGFIRETLKARLCNVIAGVPKNLEQVETTEPYYRSTYVFVTRRQSNLAIGSFDDAQLRKLIIGVQIIGDDGANSPPAHALSRRRMTANIRGFTVYGDYSKPHPLSPIIEAVAEGRIDVAVAWGPTAGYFAHLSKVPLAVAAVRPSEDGPLLPMVFDIAIGVRHGDDGLRDRLDKALAKRRADIDAILAAYSVPRVDTRASAALPP